MKQACLLGILAYNSRRDIRTKEIPLLANVLCGMLGSMWNLYTGELEPSLLCGGIALGGLLFLLGILTKEAIGIGDGVLLMVTGSFLGGTENFLLFLFALLGAGGYAAILLILKKAGRKTAIPFAPFLLAAYMGMMLF